VRNLAKKQEVGGLLNLRTLVDAARELAKRDSDLSRIFKDFGHPPLWGRPATFPTLVRIILEQQVSLKSADSMYRRLNTSVSPFTPEGFVDVGVERLRALGVTRQKTSYLLHLSTSIVSGELKLRRLVSMSDLEAKETLMRIKGIGSWSADVYLLMAMRRADIWPSGDLALAVAIKELKGLAHRPSNGEMEALAEAWRPHRAVAARMLWQYYLARRRKQPKIKSA
jgi:DNA-3-methyladenine glycosylase II